MQIWWGLGIVRHCARLSSHWRMWQWDSCPIMWLLSISTSFQSIPWGWYYYLRITRDRKGTDLQWERGHAFQCLLCSIALVSKPYLCQNHVENLLIHLVNTLTIHLGSAYYTWNCYKPFPNAISFKLLYNNLSQALPLANYRLGNWVIKN